MPVIKINVFRDELDADQSARLIGRITDAFVEVTSEKLRPMTWVIIDEVKDGQWGVGGDALGLGDVKKLMAAD